MTPDEMRQAQDAVNRPMAAASIAVLRRLPFDDVDPALWVRLVAVLYPAVLHSREQSLELARRYYASLSPAGVAPVVAAPEYPMSALKLTLDRYALPGIDDPGTRETAVAQGAAAIVRHVEQANREYIAKASSADDVRFARIDPYGETCGFCTLLISRGPVYLSQTSGAFRSHPHCTCVAVPVFDMNDWPGMEQFERAEELYARTTAGLSGRDAISAFRKAVEYPDA